MDDKLYDPQTKTFSFDIIERLQVKTDILILKLNVIFKIERLKETYMYQYI